MKLRINLLGILSCLLFMVIVIRYSVFAQTIDPASAGDPPSNPEKSIEEILDEATKELRGEGDKTIDPVEALEKAEEFMRSAAEHLSKAPEKWKLPDDVSERLNQLQKKIDDARNSASRSQKELEKLIREIQEEQKQAMKELQVLIDGSKDNMKDAITTLEDLIKWAQQQQLQSSGGGSSSSEGQQKSEQQGGGRGEQQKMVDSKSKDNPKLNKNDPNDVDLEDITPVVNPYANRATENKDWAKIPPAKREKIFEELDEISAPEYIDRIVDYLIKISAAEIDMDK